MLRDKSSAAIVAVSDIARARAFYEGVLGLTVTDDALGEVITFKTGATDLVVYRSGEAGSNRANAVVWAVGEDIVDIVAALRANGVAFEHYEMEGATYEDGIHRDGDFQMAWFKDPDGNILHLNSAE